jgi:hypothetical protein
MNSFFERIWSFLDRIEDCETCNNDREITVRGMDSDHTELIPCPDCVNQ